MAATMRLVFAGVMCEVVSLKLIVYDYLHFGRENSVRSKDLAKALGFRSVRELQRAVEQERAAGAVILSTTQNGGGYFLSNAPNELRWFTRTLEARARNTFKAAQSAQMALDAATGQESIEGWYDA